MNFYGSQAKDHNNIKNSSLPLPKCIETIKQGLESKLSAVVVYYNFYYKKTLFYSLK